MHRFKNQRVVKHNLHAPAIASEWRSSPHERARMLFSAALAALLVLGVSSFVGPTPSRAGVLPAHAVTFHENDSQGDQVMAGQMSSTAVPLTLFSELSPQFVNTGFTFANWNTSAYGNGVTYTDGEVYNFAAGPIDLYAQWTENSVTFYENRSGSDAVSATEHADNVSDLTLFSALSPAFSNPGYSFSGWSTSIDGGGTTYANGASYDFTLGDLTLFAQWQVLPLETTAFTSTSGSGATQPITGTEGSEATLPSGSGFDNPGYTFVGWNTTADGSGTEYSPGATITLTANLTLYAQWVPDIYTVSFSVGSGTVSPASGQYTVGTSALILPTPTNTGYTFTGWYTAGNGGALVGLAGAPFTPTQSTTLYAQWSADAFTVTYDATGGTVTPPQATFTTGSTALTLPTPTNGASTFLGWFTASSGGTLVGSGGATYTPSQDLTLYAQWQAPATYTITFDANGGTGTIAPISATAGSTVTLPGVSGLLKPGYTLTSWSTSKSGGATTYASGSSLTVTASITLYAQWSGAPPSVVLGSVGPFGGRATKLSAAMKSQVARLAARIKSKHYTTVTVYGYAPSVGLASLSTSISRQRANAVAAYLRQRLAALGVHVAIKSAGEGFVAGGGSVNARVEVLAH